METAIAARRRAGRGGQQTAPRVVAWRSRGDSSETVSDLSRQLTFGIVSLTRRNTQYRSIESVLCLRAACQRRTAIGTWNPTCLSTQKGVSPTRKTLRLAVPFALLSGLVLSSALVAQTGLITTVAGTGVAGTGGVGGPAANAQLNTPMGMTLDPAGNLFIADAGNNRVVRIDGATGTLSLVAGNGMAGFTGDGVPATVASLNGPSAVALDAAGNLYISDTRSNRIRRVDAQTGLITTVAGTGTATWSGDGGPATSATLNFPVGLAFDTPGNLFIADYSNARVRRVDAQTGIITTVAGNGFAGYTTPCTAEIPATSCYLTSPMWVSFNQSGELMISESGSATIQRVDAAGILRIVVGNGTWGFTGDGVIATGTGIQYPTNVVVDPAGNLFFGDGNRRIRRIDAATGIISTIAGNGTQTPGSYGCTVASGDNGPATGATVDSPAGLAITADGNLLFSDNRDCLVRRVAYPSPLPYTATNLTASATTIGQNQSVTFTATASPISASGVPSGTIQFVDTYGNTTVLGSVPLAGGSAALPVNSLLLGPHNIVAFYSGDSVFNSSTSPVAPITVDLPTTATLSSGQNPSGLTESVTVTVTIPELPHNPYSSQGNVTLLDGQTLLGGAMVWSGSAQFKVSFSTSGTHALTAVYTGTLNYAGSTSAVLNQVVLPKVDGAVVLTADTNPSPVGSPVTFTATLSPVWATGWVTFKDGSTSLGVPAVAYGTASLAVSTLAQGSHSIQVVYGGDGGVNGASSNILTQTVGTIPTTISLAANPASIAYGQAVQFTATISPSAAAGTIQFLDGGSVIGSVSAIGTGTFATSALSAGTHTITAAYLGDATHSGSTSAAQVVTVAKVSPSITLSTNMNPSVTPVSVTFVATVTPTPSGSVVQFQDGQTVIGTATLSVGPVSFSTTSLSPGTHPITAVLVADANSNSATSAVVTQTVQAPTAISVSSVNAASTYGRPVTFTASVTPSAATGTVRFDDGTTTIGTAALANGTASLTVSSLAAGNHAILAFYLGDGIYLPYSSTTWVQTVNKAPTTAFAISSVNPSTAGQAVTFTANILPATATGGVQFMDGATVLGSATLSNGSATLGTSALAGGSHSVTAVYGGDANYLGSTSGVLMQTVKFVTSTTIGTDLSSVVYGQQVTLLATVTPSAATGTVQFTEGATVLATVPVSGGTASFPISRLSTGTHSISAAYSGDALNGNSTSAPMTLTIGKASSMVATASSVNPAVSGQVVTFTATVTPAAATGTVQFLDGPTVLGSAAVSGGVAALSTSSLGAGSHSITAVYSGDTNYNSTSAGLAETVKGTTATTLSANNSSIALGQTVQLTASVAPASATGTVQFLDGASSLGIIPLSGGTAAAAVSNLAVGSHTFVAVYSGDGYDVASTSPAAAVTVSKANSSAALSSSQNPAVAGQSVTFSVTVAPTGATGTVQFKDGATVLGTVTVAGGAASFATSTLAAGSHSITAVYSGDGNYNGASASLSQIIKATTTTVLSANSSSIALGQTVQLTASVTPASATGTVQFLNGASALGTVAVSGGAGVLAVSNLAVGSHTLTAVYSGDGSDSASTSAAVAVTVSKANSSVAVVSSLNPAVSGQSVTLTATVAPAAATGTVQFKRRCHRTGHRDGRRRVGGAGDIGAGGWQSFDCCRVQRRQRLQRQHVGHPDRDGYRGTARRAIEPHRNGGFREPDQSELDCQPDLGRDVQRLFEHHVRLHAFGWQPGGGRRVGHDLRAHRSGSV